MFLVQGCGWEQGCVSTSVFQTICLWEVVSVRAKGYQSFSNILQLFFCTGYYFNTATYILRPKYFTVFSCFFPFIDQTRTSCILTSFMIASSWLSDWNPIICFVLFCLTSAWIVPWPEGQFQSHGDLWELGPPLNARASHPFLPYHETNGSFRSLSPVWVLQMLCHSYFCYENVPSPGNKKNILK